MEVEIEKDKQYINKRKREGTMREEATCETKEDIA